jgi:predicted transcriptional regulator
VEFPCEKIVRNILPAFKAYIVRELCYKYKYSQLKISKLLNITQASVSYYLNGARGDIGLKLIQTKEEIRDRLTVLTEKIATSATKPEGLLDDICELCGLIQQDSSCNPRHSQKIEKI